MINSILEGIETGAYVSVVIITMLAIGFTCYKLLEYVGLL